MHWARTHAADHLYVAAIVTNGDEVRNAGPHGAAPQGFLASFLLFLHLLRGRLVFLLLCGAR